MIIREMLIDDLDAVMQIEEALFSVPWTREGFFTMLTMDHNLFLVVEEKGQILGYCGMQWVLDEGDILNVAVCKDRQREGIGRFLVDSVKRIAQDLGIETLHL
jgi:ribosomal-protein-alanine N-acetyltransferase